MNNKQIWDWRPSRAHCMFLRQLRHPTSWADLAGKQHWAKPLGEPPQHALMRFVDTGAITRVGVAEALSYKLKLDDIKALLRERKLPLSGKKDELVERLIRADSAGTAALAQDMHIYRCTEWAAAFVDDVTQKEKDARAQLETQSLDALRKGDLLAVARIAAWSAAQEVLSSRFGIERSNEDLDLDVQELENLLKASPKILANVPEHELGPLRVAACMIHLWGADMEEWRPPELSVALPFDALVASRMILSSANFKRTKDSLRELGHRTVEVSGCEDGRYCAPCRRIAKQYAIGRVPELPYAGCTSEMGCRCTLAAGTVS